MRVTIIGAGNGGVAMAAHFASLGHEVLLYTSCSKKLYLLNKKGFVESIGVLQIIAVNIRFSSDIVEAIAFSKLVMVVTPANIHKWIANKISNLLTRDHVIVLNPGRTFGAIEFYNICKKHNPNVTIAETQTLIYASRQQELGLVNILGVKSKVLISTYPNPLDAFNVTEILNNILNVFIVSKNIFETSLSNIGCILHSSISLLNFSNIDLGNQFYFYRDLSDRVFDYIEKVDLERMLLCKTLGVDSLSIQDWVTDSYENIQGNNLKEKVLNNPAYNNILSPASIDNRVFYEDIPTGLVPMSSLANILKIETPLINSMISVFSSLFNCNFFSSGRTMDKLNLTLFELESVSKL